MAEPYIGEIRMFAGTYAPKAWMFCAGQQMQISQWDALYQLIGTRYGGDGQSTFNLPDLRGRAPMHFGNGPDGRTYPLAQAAGTQEVTLASQQIPVHTHALLANSGAGSRNSPQGAVLAGSPSVEVYRETTPSVPLAPSALTPVGGSDPHTNVQPYLCINYIISLFGIYPSPT